MILKAHCPGARSYEVGEEIWHESLAEAIHAEAETIADYAGSDLLETLDQAGRTRLRDRIITEMTESLTSVGDEYRAPDGMLYSLIDTDKLEESAGDDTLTNMSGAEPTVEQVLRFETLPLGEGGRRRAIVRWSDGTESDAMTWFPDEILICEGDLIGKTRPQLRSLHFRRDRDWLQS